MSKQVNLSGISALSTDDLKYAFDRALISGSDYEAEKARRANEDVSVLGSPEPIAPTAPAQEEAPALMEEDRDGDQGENPDMIVAYDLEVPLEDWSTEQIKTYLTENDIKFNARTTRAKLEDLAASVGED